MNLIKKINKHDNVYGQKLPKTQGQAVIEYAGALVISAVLMAAVLIFLPDDVYAFVVQMQEDIFAYLLAFLEDNI